jgi:hypothetical protein
MRPTLIARILDPQSQEPRSRAFWLVLGALVVGQLFAFWLLCSHQVRKAETRRTQLQVNQMALADCLQYIPGATIATCTRRLDATTAQGTAKAAHPSMAGATPVSFTYR